MRMKIALALSALSLTASIAYAVDLKPFQEEAKTKFDSQASDFVTEINTACGTKFGPIKSDFENFDPKNFSGKQPGTVCSETAYNLGEICKVPAYKKAVVAKIKGLACLTKPTTGPGIDFPGGVLTQHMNKDKSTSGSDGQNLIKAFLDK